MAERQGDIDAALERVRQKLAAAGQRMNPPASEDDVEAYESESDVVLPPDYRAFLLRIGDGGAGPEGRLHALGELDDFYVRFVRVRGDLALAEDGIAPREFIRLSKTAEARAADKKDELRGTVSLCDDGAGIIRVLCVHGREYGRVLRMEGEDSEMSLSYFGDFISWYEAWLDDEARGWRTFHHGRYMPGNEAELIAVAASAADNFTRRAAMVSLDRRAPTFTEATMAALRDLAGGDRARDIRFCAKEILRRRDAD